MTENWHQHIILENVAINNVSTLEAARRDATANLKWFWGPETAATEC